VTARGAVVWITGLPSSGKSTLAEALSVALHLRETPTVILDGDAVRGCLVPARGYDAAARADLYETLARLAAMVADQGLVVLVPATAAQRAFRARARALAGRYVEVFVDVPIETCVRRDAKGLYASGTADLPGATSPFERPSNPDVTVTGAAAGDVRAVLAAIDALA